MTLISKMTDKKYYITEDTYYLEYNEDAFYKESSQQTLNI